MLSPIVHVLAGTSSCGDCRSKPTTMPKPTGFLTLRGRANVAVALLVVSVIVSLLSILAERDIQSLIDAALAGQAVGITEVQAADDRVGVYAIGALVVLVGTAIAFLRWFHRAYVNIGRLGASDLRASTGWSVGSWFVPIMNLVRPKQLMDDIWRASDPARPAADSESWKSAPVSGLIHLWWAAFLFGGLVSNIAARKIMAAETLAERRGAGQADMLSEYLLIPGAILAILVVRAVTSRQEVRAAVLGATGSIAAQASYEPQHALTAENATSFPPPALGA